MKLVLVLLVSYLTTVALIAKGTTVSSQEYHHDNSDISYYPPENSQSDNDVTDNDDPVWNFPYDSDIAGPYCETRRGRQCCTGRNDRCGVPILDTVCYCDIFCNRTKSVDCCPDYFSYCLGIRDLQGRPPLSVNPPPHPQTPPRPPFSSHPQPPRIPVGDQINVVTNRCMHNGRRYKLSDVIRDNCNNCTCVSTVQSDRSVQDWRCTDTPCLIQPEILHHIYTVSPGWRGMNYSSMWGQTLEHGMQYKLGTFRPLHVVKEMTSMRSRVDDRVFPDNFDARTKWPNLIHPVQDQGQCGASWAFSTAGVASDRLSIHSKGQHVEEMSVQQLISCDNNSKQRGCNGGHIDRAWWYIRVNGVVSSTCYPYKSGRTGKKETCRPAFRDVICPLTGHEYKVFKVTPPYRISSREKDIMQEIMRNGPVQATMEVKEDFFMYRGGVYRYSYPDVSREQRKTGYHSVRILGWGVDSTTGTKYWLCANSWGSQWGERGYFRIVRGENECGIESFVLGVWAKVKANGQSNLYPYGVKNTQQLLIP